MGQDDVSDTGKKKTLSLGGGEPLSLRKPDEGGVPSRGGMSGGRKSVKVEVRRRRAPARGGQTSTGAAEIAAPTKATPASPPAAKTATTAATTTVAAAIEPAAPVTADAGPGRTRHVLKTLSNEEKSARARALS